MGKRFIRFRNDGRGATAIEYALIAGLLSILVVAGVTGIGRSLSNKFYGPVQNGLT